MERPQKSAGVEARLRAMLDADGNEVVTSRGNKISRQHYAQQLGISPCAMVRYRSVLSEYEDRLRIKTGPAKHVANMELWLNTAYEAGQLEIRAGQIDRSTCLRQFGVSGSSYKENPELLELFKRFDERAVREDYMPDAAWNDLERLKDVLAGPITLNKNRRTINLTWLVEVAKLPPKRLQTRQFRDLIQSRQREIDEEVTRSRIDPLVDAKVYPFSVLAPWWSTAFLERVGSRFAVAAPGWAKPQGPYLALIRALKWIGASELIACREVVGEAGANGRIVTSGRWEDALMAYRDDLVSQTSTKSITKRCADSRIKALRSALKGLTSGNVIPSISISIPGVRHSRRLAVPLRSFAEAQVISSVVPDNYMAFARERFALASSTDGSTIHYGDANQFLGSLALELSSSEDLPEDPVTAILQTLDRRLASLRSEAERIVVRNMEAWERGRRLLEQADIDVDDFEEKLLSPSTSNYDRRVLVRTCFPSENADVRLANLLKLLKQNFDGLPPKGEDKSSQYGQLLASLYSKCGGLSTVTSMLMPTPETVAASLTLYLVESGANLSVGRTLHRDSIESSDRSDYCRITGHKARAGGKPIIVDLPNDSSAVRAMKWLSSFPPALESDKDQLFIQRIGGRLQLMTPHWYTLWFKKFVRSIDDVSHLQLLPSMIRPTVLLQAALSNDGRLAVGMAIGQHSESVTQGYQQKWPTRLSYDRHISRFQITLETSIALDLAEPALKLGLTARQFKDRVQNLKETGLGTLCKDQRGRDPADKDTMCSTLDCWNDCPHLIIVAEVGVISKLQMWQRSLRTARSSWERDQPERWEQVWLPWLCLVDVVEQKMSRGVLAKVWNEARTLTESLSAEPGYVPPRPW